MKASIFSERFVLPVVVTSYSVAIQRDNFEVRHDEFSLNAGPPTVFQNLFHSCSANDSDK